MAGDAILDVSDAAMQEVASFTPALCDGRMANALLSYPTVLDVVDEVLRRLVFRSGGEVGFFHLAVDTRCLNCIFVLDVLCVIEPLIYDDAEVVNDVCTTIGDVEL